ncbi:MAG: PAC2 family protein [Micrococcales bacterium]|nr:PAC2 family protein [Micrococcales bacterium]
MTDSLYRLNTEVMTELDASQVQPVLLYALEGHIDSGLVAGLVISDLLANCEAKRLATFDADQLIDYRARRPPMTCGTEGWSGYIRPELVIDLVTDSAGTPFLMLYGPEPDFRWEAFAQSVLEIVELVDVRLAVGMHGLPRMVPHTRPSLVHGPGDLEVSAGASPSPGSRLHAPGSAMAMVEFSLREVAREATTLLADVPSYLAQVPYARAAVSMLEAIGQVSGLELSPDRLAEVAEASAKQLDKEVAKVDDLSRTVKELEQRFDKMHDGQVGSPKLIANQMVKDIEAYLAELPSTQDEA